MNYPHPTIQPIKSDFERLADLLKDRAKITGGVSMVEHAETCLVTNGPKKGGLIKISDTPHIKRPLELMDPGHHCQLLILMWASQSAKSVTAQIPTTYYAKVVPSECLYASTDLESMKKVMNRRLTPMLEHQGVKFITQTQTKGSRKTGDTMFQKEFAGGNLDGVTANSSAALASETKRFFAPDEAGNWKMDIGNQGNPFWQGWARLKAWGEEKKCIMPSTPGDEGECIVESLFLTGTQEEWHVECCLCGKPQVLEVQNRDGYGLDWTTRRGKIVESSIVYVCKHCAGSFTEKKKYEIQQSGIWIPKEGVEPINKYRYSLHFHSINSNFERWFEVASAFERAKGDPISKKYYDNHVAGKPHRQSGSKINTSEVIKNNRGDYKQGTVPDGVCYLVFGGDVQRGSDQWQEYSEDELQEIIDKTLADDKKTGENSAWEMKFPRIEFEILGIGPKYRSWSVDYQVIYGKIDNAFSGAFEKLHEWSESVILKNGRLGYKREKDGHVFKINMLFIDSGHAATTVYEFTQRWKFTFPCKSDREVAISKKDAHLHNTNFLPWKKSKVHNGMIDLYTLSNKFYITQMHQRLKTKRTTDDVQWATFQDFPREYPAKYFDMLTVDELTKEKGYTSRGKPNEASACRQVAFTAADVYLSQQVEIHRNRAKDEKKYSDLQIENTINSRWVIEYMAKLAKIDSRFLDTKSNYKKVNNK